ncbi:uncharacterized protein LOC111493514 [Cucurbita maxima]|uniref:Uncharacterized protein LOC111493514 n=1 Tax=Cucurbita maxima TaxID=3661 RepID=A0A6J1KBR4_CUCMA|nr:uncharacterized protein LOC111493514 [Cucurbita maxima]
MQSLLVFFIVFLAVLSTRADNETEERINKLRHQREEFGFGRQTFPENLKGPTDNIELTQIAMVQTTGNASKYIQELLPSTTDLALKNHLIVCENAYKVVSKAFQEGIELFFKKDYRSMLMAEKIAPKEQESCSVIYNTTSETKPIRGEE